MTDIQQARDVLAKWRKQATKEEWWIDGSSEGNAEVSAGRAGWEVISDRQEACAAPPVSLADARLIVGTAGNPHLLDAIDAVLGMALTFPDDGILLGSAMRISKAILFADERMSA